MISLANFVGGHHANTTATILCAGGHALYSSVFLYLIRERVTGIADSTADMRGDL